VGIAWATGEGWNICDCIKVMFRDSLPEVFDRLGLEGMCAV